jgi:hypothetical protein
VGGIGAAYAARRRLAVWGPAGLVGKWWLGPSSFVTKQPFRMTLVFLDLAANGFQSCPLEIYGFAILDIWIK